MPLKFSREHEERAFIVGTFVVIGSVGSFLQGWTVYHDLACRMGWYTFAVTCVPM
jgi:hypothetical protein